MTPTGPSSDAPMIEARGVKKRFGKVQALDGLDLVAERGRVIAVLGPNGAGKTTFVRTVATLVRPDEGTLHVAGIDVAKRAGQVRRVIGLAGQFAAVEPAMTGRENLQMIARLFGNDRKAAKANAAAVLEQLRLTDAGDRLVRTYSGCMRRRLDLGASLVGAPRLLLLDEPTTGLDPRSRIELWESIRTLRDQGTDVLLTTQYLEEADQLAQHVVIIDKGRVIASGTPNDLKALAGRDVIQIHARDHDDLAQVARMLEGIGAEAPRVDEATRSATVAVEGGTSALPEAVRALDQLGVVVDDIALRRPTLDEVFLVLTGEPIDPTDASRNDDTAPPTKSRGKKPVPVG